MRSLSRKIRQLIGIVSDVFINLTVQKVKDDSTTTLSNAIILRYPG